MVRILYDDWSIRLGENRPDQSFQTCGGNAMTAQHAKHDMPYICGDLVLSIKCQDHLIGIHLEANI